MKKTRNIALLLAVMVFGFCAYGQAISLTVGSGDYYVNVGDYDYLPYAFNAQPGFQQQLPGLSFHSAMGEYGTWIALQPYGQVWRPYVAQDWRPYTQGHWNYTQYGPTWQGYEPWRGPVTTMATGYMRNNLAGSGYRAMNGIRAGSHGHKDITPLDGVLCLLPVMTTAAGTSPKSGPSISSPITMTISQSDSVLVVMTIPMVGRIMIHDTETCITTSPTWARLPVFHS